MVLWHINHCWLFNAKSIFIHKNSSISNQCHIPRPSLGRGSYPSVKMQSVSSTAPLNWIKITGDSYLPICCDADKRKTRRIQKRLIEKHIYLINHIYPPSAWAGYDTRSIFKRSLTGLNSEFSFSYSSCLTLAEEPSLSYYLLIVGRKIIRFIPFRRVLVLCEMQSKSSEPHQERKA